MNNLLMDQDIISVQQSQIESLRLVIQELQKELFEKDKVSLVDHSF
jgi:hypothetical protein